MWKRNTRNQKWGKLRDQVSGRHALPATIASTHGPTPRSFLPGGVARQGLVLLVLPRVLVHGPPKSRGATHSIGSVTRTTREPVCTRLLGLGTGGSPKKKNHHFVPRSVEVDSDCSNCSYGRYNIPSLSTNSRRQSRPSDQETPEKQLCDPATHCGPPLGVAIPELRSLISRSRFSSCISLFRILPSFIERRNYLPSCFFSAGIQV